MNQDWNYKLVKFFINRTHLTVLLLALVVMTGLFGFSRLRTEGFPDISIPIGIVTTIVPGAGPEMINESVTTPLESAVKDVEGVNSVDSYSSRNVSTLIVNFAEDVDIEKKVQEVKNKIGAVDLPEGARDPNVMLPEMGAFAYVVAVTGEYSIQELMEFDSFKDEFAEIEEFKGFKMLNSLKQVIYINIEPGFNSPDLTAQITSADLSFPLGDIAVDGSKYTIAGQSNLDSIEDLRNLPVSINGRVFKLKDIADIYVEMDYGGQIHRVGYHMENGDFAMRGAIFYELELEAGADVLKVDPNIKEVLERINEQDEKLDYTVVYSMADQTKDQVREITAAAFGGKFNSGGPFANIGYLFGGIWLLLIILFIFLDLRSALVTIITVPLSFLVVFGFLNIVGIQLNTMVLFSLVLVLGLIVDPAIVVLESLKRYVELGFSPKDAALKAVGTIGNGIFIAVLTSFVVFVPFAVVTGLFGEIIKYIPLTVIPALVASYFVPMIFLTWIASKVFKPKKLETILDEDDPNLLWKPAQWFIKINKKILARKWTQITVVVAGIVFPLIIAGTLVGVGAIKQVQFSQPDDGLYLMVAVPTGIGIDNFERLGIAKDAEYALKDYNDEIKNFFYTGPTGLGMGEVDELIFYVELKAFAERDRTSTEIAADIQEVLQENFGDSARAENAGEGPPEGAYPVVVTIFSEDTNVLMDASEEIADQLKSYDKVLDVRYDARDKTTELSVVVDKEKAAWYGLNSPVVFGQLSGVLGESKIMTIDESDVILRVPDDKKPTTVAELERMLIFSAKGPVRLSTIAEVIEQEVPPTIQKIDGREFQQIKARVTGSKDIIEVQRDINEWIEENADSMGITKDDFKGGMISGIDFEKSFEQLFIAILVSIIITYVIFVVFFRSFIQPFIILYSLPLMFVGVFPALVVFGNGQFGFLEVLGVIMLIGIVENVGIFMIDYANQKIDQGMDKKEAIALSSGVRFRPIILTQLTSLMGLLPLAVTSPFWRGLAIVVMVGIAGSGILALFTTPVMFNWLTRRKATQ